MRLWTLHPKYLDPQGLVAVWREGLLARAVLRGKTRGYRHHPQLERFRAHRAPRAAINTYLRVIAQEAERRGYQFDLRKLGPGGRGIVLSSTHGQLSHEWKHLMRKLRRRSPKWHARWRSLSSPEPHPMFAVVKGRVEQWERCEQFRKAISRHGTQRSVPVRPPRRPRSERPGASESTR